MICGGAASWVQVGRAERRSPKWPCEGAGGGAVVEAPRRDSAAEDAGLVFVAGSPVRDIGGFGDIPLSDDAFSDAAVFADQRQVGEQIANEVGVADCTPGKAGGWGSHDGDDPPLVAAGAVGHHLATDDSAQVLESLSVGA